MEWLSEWLCRNLSDEQLQQLSAHAYDLWNWETGDPKDFAVMNYIEDERKRRKLNPPIVSTLNFDSMISGPGVTITTDPDVGAGCITITVDDDHISEQMVDITKEMIHGEV